MNVLTKLFELRESLDTYEREMGFDQLSEVEKSVLEFVMHKKDATITAITKNQYFEKYSLSTISGNLISKDEKKSLSEKLDYVLSLNLDDLKKAYREQLMSEKVSERGGAGVGLYDIALKTDKNISYNFYPVSDDLYFYLLTVELKF